jgi:hypothetical protein
MTIKIDIPNEQLSEKILWLLNRFKSDGVKITTININNNSVPRNNQALNALENIVNTKSKDSIVLDNAIVLNLHAELSLDIS